VLIANTAHSNIVLALGSGAVLTWERQFQLDLPLWQEFLQLWERLAPDCPGYNRLSAAQLGQVLEQLRRLWQQMIERYIKANLCGLLEHTRLMAAKHDPTVSMRQERRADAAVPKKKLAAAAGAPVPMQGGAQQAATPMCDLETLPPTLFPNPATALSLHPDFPAPCLPHPSICRPPPGPHIGPRPHPPPSTRHTPTPRPCLQEEGC
jgi:hypothetical protein